MLVKSKPQSAGDFNNKRPPVGRCASHNNPSARPFGPAVGLILRIHLVRAMHIGRCRCLLGACSIFRGLSLWIIGWLFTTECSFCDSKVLHLFGPWFFFFFNHLINWTRVLALHYYFFPSPSWWSTVGLQITPAGLFFIFAIRILEVITPGDFPRL